MRHCVHDHGYLPVVDLLELKDSRKQRQRYSGGMDTEAHARNRKLRIFVDKAGSNDFQAGIAASIGVVASIGMLEAFLMSKRGANGRNRFIVRYGISQILPSIIWATKPVKLVLKRAKLSESLLVKLESNRESHVYFLQTLRSIIAGFVGISQILRLVDIAGEASSTYKERCMNGQEEFINQNCPQRFIRLAGKTSDVTALTMMKQREGKSRTSEEIIPIYEDPAAITDLIRKHSKEGVSPCFWHVKSGSYSAPDSWKHFNISPSWLMPVHNSDRRVLIVEADSSVGEEALALGPSGKPNDLDLFEAGQAFVSLEKRLRQSLALTTDRKQAQEQGRVSLVRVFLLDSSLPVVSGAGRAIPQRRLVEMHDEADIIIDAKAPLLAAVKQWLENHRGTKAKRVVFDTKNPHYYRAMQKVLRNAGWVVLDRLEGSSGIEKPYANVKENFLVYENSTADTVHEVRLLVKSGLDPRNIVALLDRIEGVEELDHLSAELSAQKVEPIRIAHICSSSLYDQLFADVRKKVRDGEESAAIQQWLDKRFRMS